jgi:transposase InsO family protein
MGQVLHGSATTTEAVRRSIQRSQESVRALARRHGISPTTVQKWRRRRTTADAAMGPKQARSPVLTLEQEAVIVAFLPPPHAAAARRLPLRPTAHDPDADALQPAPLPAAARHLPPARRRGRGAGGEGPGKKRFKAYPIGYFHLDIAEVRTEAGKLYLFVAIDRTSKFAFARLHEKATRRVAADFLHALVDAVPYRIPTVLTDNGTQFTDTLPLTEDSETEAAIDALWAARGGPRVWRVHAFDHACGKHGIEHRLTKPYHPWTNGQVERMNRTLKDATVRRYHYVSHDELRAHLGLFLDAYNHARRLKALRGLTPYEFIRRAWTREPERFRLDPLHHTPGLNI